MPMIMPLKRDNTITRASEASKCQVKKLTATGAAFCAEKAATATTMTIIKMSVIITPSPGDKFPAARKKKYRVNGFSYLM